MVSGRVVATVMKRPSWPSIGYLMCQSLPLTSMFSTSRSLTGRLQPRVPVHEPLVLVDQALLVERDEHLEHRARKPLVHGEALAAPVAGRAEPAQLAHDRAARFLLPLPDFGEEGLAAHLDAAHLALGELAFDDELRGDAGVIGARLPEHVLAAHALEAGERVLQRVVQRVPDMEVAGDVRRRDDDRRTTPRRGASRRGTPRTLPIARKGGLRPLWD